MQRVPLSIFFSIIIAVVTSACNKTKDTEIRQEEKARAEKAVVAETDFSHAWAFFKTKENLAIASISKHGNWQAINLPHTMHIEPLLVNEQWQGNGWYKKEITYQPSWKGKNIFVKFEGAMMEADVWLNGAHLTKHYGGYLPFSVRLNDALVEGSNTLIVRVNNEDNPVTGPKPLKQLDFNMYGGLYRDVKLIVENPVFITDAVHANRVAGGGIVVSYPLVSNEKARVAVKTHIQSTAESKASHKIVIQQSLFRNGQQVATASSEPQELAAGANTHIGVQLNVSQPALWHPNTPNLYSLETTVMDGGRVMDEQITTVGIREFVMTVDGLLINGEKFWLRGVNRHQEYPFVGYAISPQANYRDAYRIKSAGFDFVRLSHYPHSPDFMKAADELGLILLDAILGWQYINKDPKFVAQVRQTCRDLIRRDRNHPSVLAWECSLNESRMKNMEPFIEGLNAIVHEELPGENVYSAGWVDYGYDIYLQARQHRIKHYDPPNKPYLVSEYGDWEYYAMNAGLNQDSWGDLLEEQRSSRQLLGDGEARLLQQVKNIQEAHNDNYATVAEGDGYWVMFDYNRGYADDLESSGVMSIDRLPKFSYYFFQSQRSPNIVSQSYASGPMVYIASHWQESSSLDVRVFSNAEEVELILNGKSLGRQAPTQTSISHHLQHPPFIFKLAKFEAGELEAKAYIGGVPVASHKVVSPTKAYGLAMHSDFSLGGVSSAVGDLVFVYAAIKSEAGYTIPSSGTSITFNAVKGAEIVGPSTSSSAAGIASALVKITSIDPRPLIEARAIGLQPGRISLE